MSKWRRYSVAAARTMPEGPGCYVVIIFGSISYIGQSSNLPKRFAKHGFGVTEGGYVCIPWFEYGQLTEPEVEIAVRSSDRYGDWLMHEARLIRRLKPQFNKNGVGTCL